MTRENKLALVVGFGLILFVGILISDHFSVARTQQSADLTRLAIDDPLAQTSGVASTLVDLRPPVEKPASSTPLTTLQPGQVAMHPVEMPTAVVMQDLPTIEQQSFAEEEVVSVLARPSFAPSPVTKSTDVKPLGESIPGFVIVDGVQDTPADLKIYEIRQGDSLVSLCRRHYGDANLANALAKFNGLNDPNSLRVGQKVGLPSMELLTGAPAKPAATAAAKRAPAKPKTHTVKPGETLAQIAQRIYGNKHQWRKIYDLNRDVLDDPDTVRAGTVLKVG